MAQYYLKHYGMVSSDYWDDPYLAHYGIMGMKWGVRRYQNEDGSLTVEGRARYGTVENYNNVREFKKRTNRAGFLGGPIAAGISARNYLKEHDGKMPYDNFRQGRRLNGYKKSKRERERLIDSQKFMDKVEKEVKKNRDFLQTDPRGKKLLSKMPSIAKQAARQIETSTPKTDEWFKREFPNGIDISKVSEPLVNFSDNGDVLGAHFHIPTVHGAQSFYYDAKKNRVIMDSWDT